MSLLESNAALSIANVDMSPLYNKSVLVTGATGLIGRNLVAALQYDKALDVTVDMPGRQSLSTMTYDYIVHAAGYAQPSRFLAYPFETMSLNTTDLLVLLRHLNPGGRLLFLSTSEVYSGSKYEKHDENDIGCTTPQHVRAPYIESKRCGEAICYTARDLGTTALVARVCLVYGPGVKPKDGRVMSELIDQGINDQQITLKDGGSSKRCYCYVSDTVEMLLNILLHGKQPVYNVGGDQDAETSISGLANRIGHAMHVPVVVPRSTNQAVTGAPGRVKLDMSRYQREFGAKKYVPLDEGLAKTIAWHREMAGIKGKVAA